MTRKFQLNWIDIERPIDAIVINYEPLLSAGAVD
jgi:hypothetical protein